MQGSPRSARTPSILSGSVHHQLNMYALAASAAGVGLLALVQPAEARIRYTKVHHWIGPNTNVQLDLNHDRIVDFTLGYRVHSTTSGGIASVYAAGLSGNEVEGTVANYRFFAAALKRGTRIPNRLGFSRMNARMAYQYAKGPDTRHSGNWINVTNRYLGLKFKINGKTHYGWARLSVQWFYGTLLTGYAYETIANKPIIAGETKGRDDSAVNSDSLSPNNPGSGAFLTNPVPDTSQPVSLGMLALGAQCLPRWRRREVM